MSFASQHSSTLLSRSPPPFGHSCLPLFTFSPNYVNFNNGSFGAPPKHVLDLYTHYLYACESSPDIFLRRTYQPLLNAARSALSELIHCDTRDLVFVPNATTGVNAVLRGLNGHYKKGEKILVYATVYGACGKSAQYIVDSNPGLELQVVMVHICCPISEEDFVENTRQVLKKGGVKVAILDAISSLPGVVVPWERTVKLLREYNALSLVDGAHAVGQIPLDIKRADPDFFISNCHKWLHCHRGCAFLYVPLRNQPLVPSLPTSHEYQSPNLAPCNFVSRWEWTGTQDLSSFLTVPAALEFRSWLGGEEAIMAYITKLAKEGGEIVANIIASQKTMGGAGMVNVQIPIRGDVLTAAKMQDRLTERGKTFVPFYFHDGHVWARISAQIWLQHSDFHWLGKEILEVMMQTSKL